MQKRKPNIQENMFTTRVPGENRVKIVKTFRGKDGTIWHLNPYQTSLWPNGNPHRALYESLWGVRLVVWLNEVGNLTYAQYA